MYFLLSLLSGCAHQTSSSTPFGTQTQTVRTSLESVLEEGTQSTSAGRRAQTYTVIVKYAPPSTLGLWTNRMLWDPEPYVRGAVFNSALEIQNWSQAKELMKRDALPAWEKCKYSIRLYQNGQLDSGDFSQTERRTLEDDLYCGLWDAIAQGESIHLASLLIEGELPLMLDFASDLSAGPSELGPAIEEGFVYIEPPFIFPMAAAWLQLEPENSYSWWRSTIKLWTADECEAGVEALDQYTSAETISLLQTITKANDLCSTHAKLSLLKNGMASHQIAVGILESDGSRKEQKMALKALLIWVEDNTLSKSQSKSLSALMLEVAQREETGEIQKLSFRILIALGASKYVMENFPNQTWAVQLEQLGWYWTNLSETE